MLGRTRIHTRARGSGAGAGAGLTELQQIIALSPSLLYWRALNAGTVARDGSGPIATGTDPVGRILDLSGNSNHASAPADTNRATLNSTGWVFDGSNSYYPLTNAISIVQSMTVVRAFKRASAGIRSAGLAHSADATPFDFSWTPANTTAAGLGGSASTMEASNTSTGSFVGTVARNASAMYYRRNGAQVNTTAAPTVTGQLQNVGRVGASSYTSGEICFIAVFPTELTGANLALVEQIAAATNGATLA